MTLRERVARECAKRRGHKWSLMTQGHRDMYRGDVALVLAIIDEEREREKKDGRV